VISGGLFWILLIKAIENYKACWPQVEQPVVTSVPIMTRLSEGESLLTKQNFFETLGAFVVIHFYLICALIILVATEEGMRYTKLYETLLALEAIVLTVLMCTCPALSYPVQILYIELLTIVAVVAGAGISLATLAAGLVTLFIKFVFFGLGAIPWMKQAINPETQDLKNEGLHDNTIMGLARAVLPMLPF